MVASERIDATAADRHAVAVGAPPGEAESREGMSMNSPRSPRSTRGDPLAC